MTSESRSPKLIVGCGYLGLRVAERWLVMGETVYAITRSAQRAAGFKQRGLLPILADLAEPNSLRDLPAAGTVLYAVGYDPRSGPSRRDVHIVGFEALLDAVAGTTQRLVFISTTGVYGQTSGEWVDEDSPCAPETESGMVYLEAEQMLSANRLGARAIILRLAGIYGPGRVPQKSSLTSGAPLSATGHLNLIHVDDAAQVVLDAERLAVPPRVYCVSDGHPVPRSDYYTELARLWNLPSPRFAPPEDNKTAPKRGATDKRVSNQRMLRELQTALRYPDYRQDLAAIIAAD
jgi:nucleoside-diphosphate-sugar epimerase